MVNVNFIYPQDSGYPLETDQTQFESKASKLINAFFDKWQEAMTPPASIELVVTANGGMTGTLPGGSVISDRDDLIDAWQELIDELKKIQ